MAKHSLNGRRRANRRGMHLRAGYCQPGDPYLYFAGWITLRVAQSAGLSNFPALVRGPAITPVVLPPTAGAEITVPVLLPHA